MPVSSALQFFQTLNTYSRLYPNKQAEVAQQLENLINGTTVPDTIIKKEKELLRALLIQFCKLEFISMLLFVYRNRIAQVSFHSATEILTPELNDNQFHSYYSAIPV